MTREDQWALAACAIALKVAAIILYAIAVGVLLVGAMVELSGLIVPASASVQTAATCGVIGSASLIASLVISWTAARVGRLLDPTPHETGRSTP